jgi:hypothetical protein
MEVSGQFKAPAALTPTPTVLKAGCSGQKFRLLSNPDADNHIHKSSPPDTSLS